LFFSGQMWNIVEKYCLQFDLDIDCTKIIVKKVRQHVFLLHYNISTIKCLKNFKQNYYIFFVFK